MHMVNIGADKQLKQLIGNTLTPGSLLKQMQPSTMHILAFKNFYLGLTTNLFRLSVHLGKIVLECGGHVPNSNESSQKGGDERRSDPSSGGD